MLFPRETSLPALVIGVGAIRRLGRASAALESTWPQHRCRWLWLSARVCKHSFSTSLSGGELVHIDSSCL